MNRGKIHSLRVVQLSKYNYSFEAMCGTTAEKTLLSGDVRRVTCVRCTRLYIRRGVEPPWAFEGGHLTT